MRKVFLGGTCNGSTRERTRCEVWTRVMGYHRPVTHFNIGKKSEHKSRRPFLEGLAHLDSWKI